MYVIKVKSMTELIKVRKMHIIEELGSKWNSRAFYANDPLYKCKIMDIGDGWEELFYNNHPTGLKFGPIIHHQDGSVSQEVESEIPF